MGTITKLGVVFLIVGAVVLAGPVFGFQSIIADRGVNVGTAADDNALLGLSEGSDAVVEHPDDEEVVTITNNLDTPIDEDDFETTVDAGELEIVEEFEFDDELAPGGETGLVLECGEARGEGSEEVTVTVESAAAGGVEITDVERTYDVDYDCPGQGTGDAEFDASDVGMDDPEQQFEFDPDGLTNNDDAEILLNPDGDDVEHSGLADADVEVIDGDGDAEIDAEGERIIYTLGPSGQEPDTIVLELSNFDIDGESGDEGLIEYEDEEEREDSDTFEVYAVVVGEGETESGEIDTDGDVSIGDDATTDDEVDVGGDLAAGDGYTASDEVEVEGDVSIGDDATMDDEVDVEGDAEFGVDSEFSD